MLRKNEKAHKLEKNEGFSFLLYKVFFPVFILLFIFVLQNLLEINCFSIAQVTQTNTDLGSIEEKIFHHKFETDSYEDRLSRLEVLIFGNKNLADSADQRTTKIINAFKIKDGTPSQKPQETIINEPVKLEKPTIVYEESNNEGVVGAIGQIETKLFNKTFNDLPFITRIENLEEKLLTKSEISNIRKKPIIERISILVKKVPVNQEKENAMFQSYSFDPRTGYLINEQTGEILKDNYGNQVVVMLPQSNFLPLLPQQRNPYLQGQYGQGQYGNNQLQLQQQLGIPGQLPPLDIFNQGLDIGGDSGY